MIAFFLFILFSAFAAFCGLAIYGYRSRAHSAEARANRAEGALDESRNYGEKMRDIAALAIREAAQAARIDPDEVLPRERTPQDVDPDMAEKYRRINPDIAANARLNYTSQTVAFCPSCNVSVRHDPGTYPVKCPREGCETLIDPVLDNPPELN